jgi:hypothetical protein
LKVTARTSAFAFRGKEQDITTIAEALRVRTVLEGSVRRSGSRVRVAAQLINAADGYHLWSDRYDREMTEAFTIQDEIAKAITRSLHEKLSPGASTKRYQPNPSAYEAFLKARYYMSQLAPEALSRARVLLDQAIALEVQRGSVVPQGLHRVRARGTGLKFSGASRCADFAVPIVVAYFVCRGACAGVGTAGSAGVPRANTIRPS